MARLFGTAGESSPGQLAPIPNCWIRIPVEIGEVAAGEDTFLIREIPEITDSKSANYTSQTIFGRSSPIRSYSNSEARKLSVSFNVYNTSEGVRRANFFLLRRIEAAVHPSYQPSQYQPPPVCQFQCGVALSGMIGGPEEDAEVRPVNVIIQNYSFSFGQDTFYDDDLLPFVIGVSLDLEVVYSQSTLPGSADVIAGNF